jgi:hypothetical protein
VPVTAYWTVSGSDVSPVRVRRTAAVVVPASVAVPLSTDNRTTTCPFVVGPLSTTSAKGCGPIGTL